MVHALINSRKSSGRQGSFIPILFRKKQSLRASIISPGHSELGLEHWIPTLYPVLFVLVFLLCHGSVLGGDM